MTQSSHQILLKSPEETAQLASLFAGFLSSGDTLLLTGDIGAGKTHFCRSLIQARLGHYEDVPSPTFTLIQTYETKDSEIWHADLYRLTNPDEIIELGLTDAFSSEICLVEWPDRLAELTPRNALSLNMKMTATPGERALTLSWNTVRWADILKENEIV